MTDGTRVSVLIATYNRAQLLDECLAHLRAQPFNDGDEVIVVDNGSSDDTTAVVTRHQVNDFGPPLRLVHESRPGKSRAIASGLAHASGDILAFTDDDVNVDLGWLDAIRSALADPTVALVGGPVTPRFDSTVPNWIRRACERHPRLGAPLALLDYGADPCELGPRSLLGANLAVRRSVFEQVGGFPTHLGKLRGTLLSGEDHALCVSVQEAGFRAVYCPGATVRHWVPPHRARAAYFLEWFFWSGITNAVLDSDAAPRGFGIRGMPMYLMRRAALASAGMIAGFLIGRRTSALNRAVDIAFAAGYAAERWRLRTRGEASGTPARGST